MALNLIMKNSFFRKIAFGLNLDDDIPDDPLGWAIKQVSNIPDYTWKGNVPVGSDQLKIYGNFIFNDRKVLRKKYKADPKQYKHEKKVSKQKYGVDYFEPLEIAIRHDAALNGKLPVCHRFLHFWGNHFAISKKDAMHVFTTGPYHRETIGPALTGNFFDLLKEATLSWSMIHHLDNSKSIGPHSIRGAKLLQRKGKISTINENHARELLELHTVSPSCGYTQQDVINTSYLMTGWEHKYSKKYLECGPVHFNSKNHEPGAVNILGKEYKQSGVSQSTMLYELLEDLANHPSTREFISWKLCRHFISDTPPKDAVQAVIKAWQESKGHLPSIHKAVIEQTWKYTNLEKKFLMPETWLLQIANLCNAKWPLSVSDMEYDFKSIPYKQEKIFELMKELGHAPFRAEQPNGFPDTEAEWLSPELLIRRFGLVNIEDKNRLRIKTKSMKQMIIKNFDNSTEIFEKLNALPNDKQKISLLLSSSWMLKV